MFRGLSLKWTEGFQGEEEIRDTNIPIFFRVPSFCLTDSYLGGGGVESVLISEKNLSSSDFSDFVAIIH